MTQRLGFVKSVHEPVWNPTELQFAQWAESQGWQVTKRGWPDFICRRDGELMAVEVKGLKDSLRPEQRQTLRDLRAAGIPTYMWVPDTGFVEVGGPTGESVHSLHATIGDLRRRLAELEARVVPEVPQRKGIVKWSPNLSDPEAIASLARTCKRQHPEHRRWNTTAPFCANVVLLSDQGNSVQVIASMMGRPVEYVQRRIDFGIAYVIEHQHRRLHLNVGLNLRCSQCKDANAA